MAHNEGRRRGDLRQYLERLPNRFAALASATAVEFWELWQTYCTGKGQLRLGW